MNRLQALFMPVATEGGERYSVALPLLLAMFTLVLWFGFQSWQLVAERNNLKVLAANQATMYANAQKMRAQLDSIASGIAPRCCAMVLAWATISPLASQMAAE